MIFHVADVVGAHRRLMRHSPTPEVARIVRTNQNWIGGSAYTPIGSRFAPPPPDHVGALLEDLIEYVAGEEHSPLVQAAPAHAQFETIQCCRPRTCAAGLRGTAAAGRAVPPAGAAARRRQGRAAHRALGRPGRLVGGSGRQAAPPARLRPLPAGGRAVQAIPPAGQRRRHRPPTRSASGGHVGGAQGYGAAISHLSSAATPAVQSSLSPVFHLAPSVSPSNTSL